MQYLQDQREEALSLLNQSEETIRERHGDESEKRLIVTYGDMAWLKYHDGDFAQSQSYCQKVEDILVKYPTGSSGGLLPEVYGDQAWTYFKVSWSSLSKAIDCFHKALEVQRHDTEWNAGYAIALFCREQWVLGNKQEDEESKATKQLRFALEINPNNAVLQCMLALKLTAYKKYEEADGLVNKALENDPDNPHVIRHSGNYLHNRNRLDEAIDVLKRGLRRGDQLPSFNYQLFSAVFSLQGLLMPLKKYDWRQCAQKLKQIAKKRLSRNPGDGEALALLGQVARAEGDRKEAALFYEEALNYDKDNEEYLSALCELRLELQGSSD
ncbi:interferon-induced protein with tetratricopeptide repeats 5-like [Neolamprologus brichardi]|uniref:interferon-induced protein with tetratricopeptide repeats 5-like n=1 Tax=Neolamprologus brichardi TaxID=32507 RepID=UPI0016439834|nr:interferon-induced protein with tetratricopeptide repeats 5-like [Neolamprologus brichardi]